MNKPVVGIFAVLGIALATGIGYWAGARQSFVPAAPAASASAGKGSGQASGSGPAITVQAIKVMTAALPQTITAVGSLRSDESVVIRPEVAGRVSAILFHEGQRVPKG